MKSQSDLLQRSSQFVSAALLPLIDFYAFHNLEHTKGVVRAARAIARASKLTAGQLDVVIIAAWFHDVGYCHGARAHEERSATIARTMLGNWGANGKLIEEVCRAVLATKLPQNPHCIIDMVLCDADLAHLASNQYQLHASRLRTEFEAQGHEVVTEAAWNQLNIEFMKRHRYFTDYGKTIMEGRKKINLKKLGTSLTLKAA